jgi:hypothetical protein
MFDFCGVFPATSKQMQKLQVINIKLFHGYKFSVSASHQLPNI